jgi:hypothetical protein
MTRRKTMAKTNSPFKEVSTLKDMRVETKGVDSSVPLLIADPRDPGHFIRVGKIEFRCRPKEMGEGPDYFEDQLPSISDEFRGENKGKTFGRVIVFHPLDG